MKTKKYHLFNVKIQENISAYQLVATKLVPQIQQNLNVQVEKIKCLRINDIFEVIVSFVELQSNQLQITVKDLQINKSQFKSIYDFNGYLVENIFSIQLYADYYEFHYKFSELNDYLYNCLKKRPEYDDFKREIKSKSLSAQRKYKNKILFVKSLFFDN